MPQANFPLHRRDALAAVSATMLGTMLVAPLKAAEVSGDSATVAIAVEALSAAMVAGDENALNALANDHLTYGHSSGFLQNKTAFVKYLAGPNAPGKFNWIKLSDQTIDVVGDVALVRHVFDAENVSPDGKTSSAHILNLQVWMNETGGWKLLARQACPLQRAT
jgi:ketosteroid isomerase-like protein